MAGEEERAGRGMVREDRGRDSDSAAEEWAEVEAGRDRVPAEEEQEPEARAEAAVRVRVGACGTPAPEEARDPAVGTGLVVAQGRVEDREAEAELGLGRVVRVAEGLAPGPVGVGERVAVRVEVARVRAEERAQVQEEADSAEVGPAPVQVLDPEAQDLAAGVVREGLAEEEPGLVAGRDRAERERREDG